MCEPGAVEREFHEYSWFGVCVCNAGASCCFRSGYHILRTHIFAGDIAIEPRMFGDIEVLAMQAFEVASDCRNRVRTGTRQKMKERFFFDRVNTAGYYFPIDKAIENTAYIFPYSADASFAGSNSAILTAQSAFYGAVTIFLIK
jgi:hypothetical protein